MSFQFNKCYGLDKTFSKKVHDRILAYDWPGNIRELENLIERLVLTAEDSLITEKDLPSCIMQKAGLVPGLCGGKLTDALKNLEKQLVADAYEQYGTTVGVAEALGISQPTAVRKIQKYITRIQS